MCLTVTNSLGVARGRFIASSMYCCPHVYAGKFIVIDVSNGRWALPRLPHFVTTFVALWRASFLCFRHPAASVVVYQWSLGWAGR